MTAALVAQYTATNAAPTCLACHIDDLAALAGCDHMPGNSLHGEEHHAH
jgi:hypothetical protein